MKSSDIGSSASSYVLMPSSTGQPVAASIDYPQAMPLHYEHYRFRDVHTREEFFRHLYLVFGNEKAGQLMLVRYYRKLNPLRRKAMMTLWNVVEERPVLTAEDELSSFWNFNERDYKRALEALVDALVERVRMKIEAAEKNGSEETLTAKKVGYED